MSNHGSVFALVLIAFCAVQLAACRQDQGGSPAQPTGGEIPTDEIDAAHAVSPDNALGTRNAYFGDLHIHTQFSIDAYIFGARKSPDDAYRYAKGEPLMHDGGYPIRLRGAPLDFLGVTDHAGSMGVFNAMRDPRHELSKSPLAKELSHEDPTKLLAALAKLAADSRFRELNQPAVLRDTWRKVIAAAERHYDPGEFTTFIAYEYSSAPGYNLHRNVVFRGSNVPEAPFSQNDSLNPEDLWRWLDEQRAQGNEALAIPHNSNWSAGHTFARQQESGEPFDEAYAELRMRNEPIVEVTQGKGTSETHPLLSPNDEWADFEIWNVIGPNPFVQVASTDLKDIRGGYARDAYLAGLAFEEDKGFNPFRFGMIGSSDSHNAAGSYQESSHFSGHALTDATPELRESVPPNGAKTWENGVRVTPIMPMEISAWSASGLAGVWADQNTREAIFDAMRRKETFATSGPRIRVRLFGGFDYPQDLPQKRDALAQAYAGGVPMGGDLAATNDATKTPRFFAWAIRDPTSGWLQRVQIVKGWIEGGESHERVFDVACSGGLTPDPQTHRCPDNGATVNLADCSTSFDKGAAELSTLWSDPTFQADQRAFYYVRVLENPSCRWSTWDAIRAGVPPNPKLKTTIQERAWSSPIWYVP